MVKQKLDAVFNSLSDSTRRDILQRLSTGELTVSEVANAYSMSLPAISKHLKVLESAGLITKERRGKQQIVRLSPRAFQDATNHLQYYEMLLHSRLDSLEEYLNKETPMNTTRPTQDQIAKKIEEKEITVTHSFDSPRERVWDAYTDPSQVAKWWVPEGSELIECETDVREGGIWRFVLRGRDGRHYTFSGVFLEVKIPERLVYTDGFGEAGDPRPESTVTLDFEELPDGRTRLIKRLVATPIAHQLQAAWLESAERSIR